MPQNNLNDLFMAGFGSTFAKEAEAEEGAIDLSEMPVMAKLAANLGLVETEEATAEEADTENMSLLEKLAFLGFGKGKPAPKSRTSALKERLQKMVAKSKEHAGAAGKKISETAKKHPKITKGVTHGAAAAGGIGLGALLSGGKKEKK